MTKLLNSLTAEYMRSIINYDPKTGVFRWNNRANKLAGSINNEGYLHIGISYKIYKAHRLAWLIMMDKWPEFEIDHRDTNRSNNRWKNLRCATQSQNLCNRRRQKNNTSGFKGVSWDKINKNWQANIHLNGRLVHLGRLDSPKEAHTVYCKKALQFRGEFARTA